MKIFFALRIVLMGLALLSGSACKKTDPETDGLSFIDGVPYYHMAVRTYRTHFRTAKPSVRAYRTHWCPAKPMVRACHAPFCPTEPMLRAY